MGGVIIHAPKPKISKQAGRHAVGRYDTAKRTSAHRGKCSRMQQLHLTARLKPCLLEQTAVAIARCAFGSSHAQGSR